MSFTQDSNRIFNQAIHDYHVKDNIDTPICNPFEEGTIENRLYLKCWIDTARTNTESPAWAVDRLSILALKIYHMKEQAERTDATPEHVAKCKAKLSVLLEQQKDLSTAIDQLLEDIAAGRKYMKVYRQMKMYNDVDTNPVLYKK